MLGASSAARVQAEGTALAIVLWAADRNDPALAGFLISGSTLPQVVTGPWAGRTLDRVRHPEAFVAVAAVVAALGSFTIAVSDLRVVPAVAGALALSVSTPVLTGGLSSVIMGWGDDTHSLAAWDSTGYNVAGLAAPVVVTVLAIQSAPAAFVALGSVAMLTVPAVLLGRTSNDRQRAPGLVRLRDALHAIRASRPLLAITIATTLLSAALGGLHIALASRLASSGLSTDRVGVLATAIAVGALGGSLLMTRVRPARDPISLTIVSIGLSGALICGLAFAPWTAMIVIAFVFGVVDAPLLVGTYRARSEHAPTPLRSSVFTIGASFKLGAHSVGALTIGLLATGGPSSLNVLVIGVTGLAAAGIAAAITPGLSQAV